MAQLERGKFSARPRNDPKYFGGDIPFIQTGDVRNSGGVITSYSQTLNLAGLKVSKLFPAGTLFLTIAANIGDLGIASFASACPDSLVAVRPYRRTHKEWLYYALTFQKAVLESIATQNAQLNLNLAKLNPFPMLVPPYEEQAAIAETLGDVDSYIRSLDRAIAKKQAIKQGMMQQLLNGSARLPGFKKPWRRLRIEDILAPRTQRNLDGAVTEVLTCTKHDGFVRSLDYFKNQVFSRDLKGYIVIHRGDIGYPANHVEEGSIGVQEVVDRGLVSPIYVVMQPRADVDTYFLQRQLKLEAFRHEFARVTNASVNRRGSLRWREFSQIFVSVPDIDEQRAISQILRDAELAVTVLHRRWIKAKEVKRGMMQELLTGRTHLPAAEAVA
jgi:type I restriction enzyme S subunit